MLGGSRGIGKVIVENFLAQGANVSYCARKVTGNEFKDFRGAENSARAVGSVVDVGSEEQLRSWVEKSVDAFGRIDTVIANGMKPICIRGYLSIDNAILQLLPCTWKVKQSSGSTASPWT